ncbi:MULTISPECIES: LuxR C-terminal-related transcriptional regulator [Amycolatopsis]|uniref:GAF modulated transcriptional regulator, LuxR family n=1 Tax=Amycolatopsis rubida TaxID=112413 RepID=A0A1I6B5I0_9PSEU|nr:MULTISPECIES: LuxR C-terminal-related transcriptional regulator [Amycolatopsis]OAP29101.1 transcriptional regulator NarP [Amycolatopsis sp. M39]SFQ76201.1 GAF modulated transcriptional regulator, LuxR family [Amycolatopsis rubida]
MTSAAETTAEVRRALARLRGAAGVPLSFGGEVVDGKRLRMTELLGTATTSLLGLVVAEGKGLGGRAIGVRKPVVLPDYYTSDAISHHFDRAVKAEGVRSVMAVPVIVQRTVRAVLYGAVREHVRFGDRSVTAMVEVARDLEQELAVRAEAHRRLDLLAPEPERAPPGKPAELEALRESHAELRRIAAAVDDPELRARIDAVCQSLTGDPARGPSLSARELDVLEGAAAGQTNAGIAEALGLGPETVKSYLRNAMRKLDAKTRLQAVNAARRANLLP